MKQKSSIYNNSYKIGLGIFIVGVVVTSVVVTALYNVFLPSFKMTTKNDEPIFYEDSTIDTVYVPKIETRVVYDTIRVYCKKKHCEEVHVPTDSTKS
jgi:hypothetical protein